MQPIMLIHEKPDQRFDPINPFQGSTKQCSNDQHTLLELVMKYLQL